MKFQNSDADEHGQIRHGASAEQFYDLDKDVGKHTNLGDSPPERLKSMRERFAILTTAYTQRKENSGD